MSGFEEDRNVDMFVAVQTADRLRQLDFARSNGLTQEDIPDFVLNPSSLSMTIPDLAIGALSKYRDKFPQAAASPSANWYTRNISTRIGSAVDKAIDGYVKKRFSGDDQLEVAAIELLWSADSVGKYYEPDIHQLIQDARDEVERSRVSDASRQDGMSTHSRKIAMLHREARAIRKTRARS